MNRKTCHASFISHPRSTTADAARRTRCARRGARPWRYLIRPHVDAHTKHRPLVGAPGALTSRLCSESTQESASLRHGHSRRSLNGVSRIPTHCPPPLRTPTAGCAGRRRAAVPVTQAPPDRTNRGTSPAPSRIEKNNTGRFDRVDESSRTNGAEAFYERTLQRPRRHGVLALAAISTCSGHDCHHHPRLGYSVRIPRIRLCIACRPPYQRPVRAFPTR